MPRGEGWGGGAGADVRSVSITGICILSPLLWRSARAQAAQPGLLIPRPKPMATIAQKRILLPNKVPLGQDKLGKEGGPGKPFFSH